MNRDIGICEECGKKTSEMIHDYSVNYHNYLCAKCKKSHGYITEKEQREAEMEFAKCFRDNDKKYKKQLRR